MEAESELVARATILNLDAKLITYYIGAWSWFIVAMIFLVGGGILLSLAPVAGRGTLATGLGFLFVFVICIFIAFIRRKNLYE